MFKCLLSFILLVPVPFIAYSDRNLILLFFNYLSCLLCGLHEWSFYTAITKQSQ